MVDDRRRSHHALIRKGKIEELFPLLPFLPLNHSLFSVWAKCKAERSIGLNVSTIWVGWLFENQCRLIDVGAAIMY